MRLLAALAGVLTMGDSGGRDGGRARGVTDV